MIKLLILIVLAGVGVWLWQTRRDEIMALLGKKQDTPTKDGEPGSQDASRLVGHHRPTGGMNGALEVTAGKLTPLDVPMIQARYEKLGIWEHLNEHQADTLRQTILTHCKEGREELWWQPLIEFARFLDYQKGEMPALIMDETTLQAVQVRKYLFAMDYRLRRSGLALEEITGPKGEEIEQETELADGTYKVIYKVKDRAFRFPFAVRDGKLDIEGLVRTVNGLCERKKAKGRFLLLPPAQPTWCVIYALFTTAEQVQRSNWAQLPLPKALAEEDMERVSEELHSVEPPDR